MFLMDFIWDAPQEEILELVPPQGSNGPEEAIRFAESRKSNFRREYQHEGVHKSVISITQLKTFQR